ncbi:MAG: DsbC family protein [Gammaproteobacteria bacterium]|nr:DsbC family protein [Gammaproteobacteria bacterium]
MNHPTRFLLLAAASLTLGAASTVPQQPAKSDARADIARRLDIKPEEIRPAPVPGLYEVRSGSEVGYVSTDGRYYIDGDIFDMDSKENLTERTRLKGRLELLAGIPDADAIVFAPSGPVRYTLTVFTDVDCTFCRRMHQEMTELNGLGIRIRYLMYPRSGPDTESWRKAEAVWCSADRRDALTRAKRGEIVKAPKCETPVARDYAIGREIGLRGTPGIFTEQGEYLAGYMPAQQLFEYLSKSPTGGTVE